MEKITGQDALRKLPLKEILLDFNGALDIINKKARRAVEINVANLREAQKGNPHMDSAYELLDIIESTYLNTPPGGRSFSDKELKYVYEDYADQTYSNLIKVFADEIFPGFFRRKPEDRAPGCIMVGYLLDLVDIVNPDIATYEERVVVIAQTLRRIGFDYYDLGVSFDDAHHLRGTIYMPGEFLLDKKDVKKFLQIFLNNLNKIELSRFKKGYEDDIVDILNNTSSNLN